MCCCCCRHRCGYCCCAYEAVGCFEPSLAIATPRNRPVGRVRFQGGPAVAVQGGVLRRRRGHHRWRVLTGPQPLVVSVWAACVCVREREYVLSAYKSVGEAEGTSKRKKERKREGERTRRERRQRRGGRGTEGREVRTTTTTSAHRRGEERQRGWCKARRCTGMNTHALALLVSETYYYQATNATLCERAR